MERQQSAQEAFLAARSSSGFFKDTSASFVCPNCGAYAQHLWGVVGGLGIPLSPSSTSGRTVTETGFVFAACLACKREAVFYSGSLVHPQSVTAPAPHADLPAELVADFEEARQISSLSPRGAAALLRLVIQKLCPLIGAKEDSIDKMIGELVRVGKIPAIVQKAMDSIRVWGNESVHPGELDIRDDASTVAKLFSLVNFVVEKAIAEPKQVAEIFGALPAGKLEGIARRDNQGLA